MSMTHALRSIAVDSLAPGDLLRKRATYVGATDLTKPTHVVSSVRKDGVVFLRRVGGIGSNPAQRESYSGERSSIGSYWLVKPIQDAYDLCEPQP